MKKFTVVMNLLYMGSVLACFFLIGRAFIDWEKVRAQCGWVITALDPAVAWLALTPESCLWWSALAIYLAFFWLGYGPYYTRLLHHDPEWSKWWRTETDDYGKEVVGEFGMIPLEIVWLFAPLWGGVWLAIKLFYVALAPVRWLIYGR